MGASSISGSPPASAGLGKRSNGIYMAITIPQATHHPEYHLTLVWRADADGNGIRAYFARLEPNETIEYSQASFHPTLDLLEAVESALTNVFEIGVKSNK